MSSFVETVGDARFVLSPLSVSTGASFNLTARGRSKLSRAVFQTHCQRLQSGTSTRKTTVVFAHRKPCLASSDTKRSTVTTTHAVRAFRPKTQGRTPGCGQDLVFRGGSDARLSLNFDSAAPERSCIETGGHVELPSSPQDLKMFSIQRFTPIPSPFACPSGYARGIVMLR